MVEYRAVEMRAENVSEKPLRHVDALVAELDIELRKLRTPNLRQSLIGADNDSTVNGGCLPCWVLFSAGVAERSSLVPRRIEGTIADVDGDSSLVDGGRIEEACRCKLLLGSKYGESREKKKS